MIKSRLGKTHRALNTLGTEYIDKVNTKMLTVNDRVKQLEEIMESSHMKVVNEAKKLTRRADDSIISSSCLTLSFTVSILVLTLSMYSVPNVFKARCVLPNLDLIILYPRLAFLNFIGTELRITCNVMPAIVMLCIAINDTSDLMPDHVQRFFLIISQPFPTY